MEMLSVLEKKVASLIHLIKELRARNEELVKQNQLLSSEVHQFQNQLLEGPQEIELAKLVVDDLIKNIDELVEFEKHL